MDLQLFLDKPPVLGFCSEPDFVVRGSISWAPSDFGVSKYQNLEVGLPLIALPYLSQVIDLGIPSDFGSFALLRYTYLLLNSMASRQEVPSLLERILDRQQGLIMKRKVLMVVLIF